MIGARIRAHAPSIWSRVPIEGAIVLLYVNSVSGVLAIKERLVREFFAIQFFFYNHLLLGVKDFFAILKSICDRMEMFSGDFDALSAGESIWLNHEVGQ